VDDRVNRVDAIGDLAAWDKTRLIRGDELGQQRAHPSIDARCHDLIVEVEQGNGAVVFHGRAVSLFVEEADV
jgi:hypothetical protein